MTEKPVTFGPQELYRYVTEKLGLRGRHITVYPARLGSDKLVLSKTRLDDMVKLQGELEASG